MKEPKVIPVSVAIPPDLAHKARVEAALQGKSRSQLIREVLEEALSTMPARVLTVRAEGNFSQMANLPG